MPRAQRGLGLLETMFLVLLIGGALLAAFMHLRAQAPTRQAEAQAAALAWADRALIGFAAANARLPCPAVQPDGAEDCSGNAAKGWLPVATLSLIAANPGPGTLPMGYVAYRGAGGSDLVKLTDQFNPHRWDGNFYATFGALNGADFCVALAQAQANPTATAQAYFLGASGVVNVAYGIVAASPLGGSGASLFDGVNVGSGVQLEAPTRALTPGYGDRVRVRGFDTLSAALNCANVLASLDGLALAADVLDETASQKDSLRTSAIIASTINSVKTAVAILKVVMAGIAMGTAVAALAAAVSELVSAIAGCIFLVGCGFIATAAAAVAAAAGAIVAAGAAIALNAGAVVAQAVATGLMIAVAVEAGAPFDEIGNGSLDEAIAAAHDAAVVADDTAAKARNEYNSAVVARDNANRSMDLAWQNLIAHLGGDQISAADTQRLNAYRAALDDWYAAQQRLAAATSARKAAATRVSQLADALVRARQDYAAKRAAWLAETIPSERQRREMEMNNAAQTVTSIEQAQGVAASDLDSAIAAENAGNAEVASTKAARDQAYAALLAAHAGDFLVLPILSGEFESRYKDYIGKRDLAERKYDAMRVAEDKARDAWDGYNTLLAIEAGGGVPGGSEVTIGAGHREILEQADRRGAVR